MTALTVALDLGDNRHWRDDALCAQADPAFWFPERGAPPTVAKAICGRCPVRVDCLDWAVPRSELVGVWGGKSSRERRKLRTERLGVRVGKRRDAPVQDVAS